MRAADPDGPNNSSSMGRPTRWYFALSIGYMVVIWALSSVPGSEDPPRHWLFRFIHSLPGGDKTAHVIEYAGLAFLLAHALDNPFLVLAASIAYGLVDEIHQSFVPLRDAGWPDLLADTIGTLIGLVLARALRRPLDHLLSLFRTRTT